MELFVGSDVRLWSSAADVVSFGVAPQMYTPGPSAMRHLVDLPTGVLRRFLLLGLDVEEAHELKLVGYCLFCR